MFAHRYFADRYFAPRYFPEGNASQGAPVLGVSSTMLDAAAVVSEISDGPVVLTSTMGPG